MVCLLTVVGPHVLWQFSDPEPRNSLSCFSPYPSVPLLPQPWPTQTCFGYVFYKDNFPDIYNNVNFCSILNIVVSFFYLQVSPLPRCSLSFTSVLYFIYTRLFRLTCYLCTIFTTIYIYAFQHKLMNLLSVSSL